MALRHAKAVDAAEWMDESHKAVAREQAQEALLLLSERTTHERGLRSLERLDSAGRALEWVNQLAKLSAESKPLQQAFLAADGLGGEAGGDGQAMSQLGLISQVAAKMAEYRELTGEAPAREDLRAALKQLDRRYLAAEQALIAQIAEMATKPGAMGDPAVNSLLLDQSQSLSDLKRVREVERWTALIGLLRPESSAAFANQTRKMVRWLGDPVRREDAVAAMSQFAQQAAMFHPLPLEAELAAADARIMTLTAQQAPRLAQRIAAQREQWARAWGEGNAGSEAANRMLLLRRLTLSLRDAAQLLETGQPAGLSRWGGWAVSDSIMLQGEQLLRHHLQLAVIAAIDDKKEELQRSLDRIDSDLPSIRLAGRITALLGDSLSQLPFGSAMIVGQAARLPDDGAWLLDRRAELDEIGRYWIEHAAAKAAGQEQAAAELAKFVNERSWVLLESLGDRRAPLPTLLGFDGKDPIPKGP